MSNSFKTLLTRTLLPLWGVFAILVPFGVLFGLRALTLPQHHLARLTRALELPATPPEGGPYGEVPDDIVLAPFVWATSALVLAVALIVGLAVLLYVILLYRKRQGKCFKWLALAALVLSAVLSYNMLPDQDKPVQALLEMLVAKSAEISRPWSAWFTDSLAAINIILLVWAYCILCLPLRKDGAGELAPEDGVQELVRRRGLLKWLLYISAIHLSTGVVQIFWTFRLPGNVETLGISYADLDTLASGIGLWFGAGFTALLICVYGSAAIVLGKDAERLIPDETAPDAEEEWLRDQGLSASNWELLFKTLAVLGPLLTAWVGEAVGKFASTVAGIG